VGGALRSAMLGEEPNDLDLHLSTDCPAAASSIGNHIAAAEAVLSGICTDLAAMGVQCSVQREEGELASGDGKSGGSSKSSSKSSSTSSSKSSNTSSTSPAAVAPMLRVYWDMNSGAATSTADQVSSHTHADYLWHCSERTLHAVSCDTELW
jgi:hypothetical protein